MSLQSSSLHRIDNIISAMNCSHVLWSEPCLGEGEDWGQSILSRGNRVRRVTQGRRQQQMFWELLKQLRSPGDKSFLLWGTPLPTYTKRGSQVPGVLPGFLLASRGD